MMESNEDMGLDGGYGVDWGRSGENIEDVGPIALEFSISLKPTKRKK